MKPIFSNTFVLLSVITMTHMPANAAGGRPPQGQNRDWSCSLNEGKTICTSDIALEDWLSGTSEMKSEVARQSAIRQSFSRDEYLAIKIYFSRLNSFALYLTKSTRILDSFNESVEKEGVSSLCSHAFISRDQWQNLKNRCTRNGYFVCSEEVKAYADSVAAIFARLSADIKPRFNQSAHCPKLK